MSRIGKKVVEIPAGVKVTLKGRQVEVAGAKTKLTYEFRPELKVTVDEAAKTVAVGLADGADKDDFQSKASWGSTRAHIANMIIGVTKGYERQMQVVGTGWSATVTGKTLKMVCGFANPVVLQIPDGLTVTVDKSVGEVTPVKIVGSDKQLVGQFASTMRSKKKPEPYNGKGIKYLEETIKRKQGKQFGA